MSKRLENGLKTNELIADLVAFRSILFKLGYDKQADDEKLFVEMANQAGFRTIFGKELTYMGYRQLFKRADQDVIRAAVKEVTAGKIVYSFG